METVRLETHTHKVLNELHDVLMQLQRAETGQRGREDAREAERRALEGLTVADLMRAAHGKPSASRPAAPRGDAETPGKPGNLPPGDTNANGSNDSDRPRTGRAPRSGSTPGGTTRRSTQRESPEHPNPKHPSPKHPNPKHEMR